MECREYLDDQIQDAVFHSILQRFYEKFILLNDKFEVVTQEGGLAELSMRLKKCFDIVCLFITILFYNFMNDYDYD